MPLFTSHELENATRLLPDWKVDSEALQRSFDFVDFVAAMRFVNHVAALAEQHGHHPDIDIRYNRVLIRTWSHDSGGVTERDLQLATAMDRLLLS